MENALQVYECPTCGDILEDEVYSTGQDDLCLRCNSAVNEKTIEAQGPFKFKCRYFKLVDRRRWMEARGHYHARRES